MQLKIIGFDGTTLFVTTVAYIFLNLVVPFTDHKLLAQTEETELHKLCINSLDNSQYESGLNFCQKLLDRYQKNQNLLGQAQVFNYLGIIYRNLENYPKSIQMYTLGLRITKKNIFFDDLELQILSNLGNALFSQGIKFYENNQFSEALQSWQEVLNVFKSLTGKEIQRVNILLNIGAIYGGYAKYDEAINSFESALNIIENLPDSEDKILFRALISANIGNIFYIQSKYENALDYYTKALNIIEKYNYNTSNQEQIKIKAQFFGNIAGIYLAKNEYQKALVFNQKAIDIFKEMRLLADLTTALNRTGDIYESQYLYEKALNFYQESIQISKLNNIVINEINSLVKVASVYIELGNYSDALTLSEQALKLLSDSEKTGKLENIDQRIDILNNLGINYKTLDKYQDALKTYELALNLVRKDDNIRKHNILSNVSIVYKKLGLYEKALLFQQEALAIALKSANRNNEGSSRLNIGNIYENLNQYQEALKFQRQALDIAQATQNYSLKRSSLIASASSLFKLNRLVEAEKDVRKAIEIGEVFRKNLNQDNNKILFYDTQIYSYQLFQEILVSQNKYKEALVISEQSRARAFSELLEKRLSQATDFSLPKKQIDLEAIKQIAKEQNATIVEYGLKIDTLEIRITEKPLQESNESYYINLMSQGKYVPSELYVWIVKPTGVVEFRQVDLKPLQKKQLSLTSLVPQVRNSIGVRGSNTTNINFAAGTRLHFKGDKPNSEPWEVVSIDIKNNTLMVRLPSFAPNVAIPKPISEVEDKGETSLQQLYQILIQPIADLLPTKESDRVIFIPQGSLFLVPFATLQDSQGKYLIEKHTILTAPSIQVLDLTRKQRQRLTGTAKNVLVVGNPSPMPEPFQPLKYAESEAIDIAKQLGTTAIIGKDATESAIVAQMPNARIIHLATHGRFEDTRGLGSAIALAPSGKDNGLLTAEEILNLKLNAELVVLSACDTGRGRLTGDGVIGLSRSLISAGVPSVIVSLWKVPDDTTAGLMPEFYRQLQRNPDKAQALRQAMLVTMKQHPNPRDWAAFTLIGEAE